ncbi:MAG: hypothetical protein U9M92_00415 [Patescibacteria group bacterium]|nr:hypothetical protein [Patescibacteria group bacterium]
MTEINRANTIFSAVSLVALLFVIFFMPTNCDGGVGVLGCGQALRVSLSALIFLNVVAQIIFSLWRLSVKPPKKAKQELTSRCVHYLLLVLVLVLVWFWFAVPAPY